MTENEAIEKLHAYLECESRRAEIVSCNESCDDCELCYMQGTGSEHIESVETAIKALEEVQQYRQICTVEECRAAVEMRTAKKPIDRIAFKECPTCGHVDIGYYDFCERCGQRLDWSDDDGKTD